jgi:hypothetical protein
LIVWNWTDLDSNRLLLVLLSIPNPALSNYAVFIHAASCRALLDRVWQE